MLSLPSCKVLSLELMVILYQNNPLDNEGYLARLIFYFNKKYFDSKRDERSSISEVIKVGGFTIFSTFDS